MKNINFKVLSCILGASLALNSVPVEATAETTTPPPTKSKKAFVATALGTGALALGGIIFLIFKSFSHSESKSGAGSETNHTSKMEDLNFSADENQIFRNLKYWIYDVDIVNKFALESALNIYSLRTCGVKYRELIDSLKTKNLRKDASDADFYNFVCSNTDLGGDKHEYIENICFILKYKEQAKHMRDYAESGDDVKAFGEVAKVIFEFYKTLKSQPSPEIKQELETFKKGKDDPCLNN